MDRFFSKHVFLAVLGLWMFLNFLVNGNAAGAEVESCTTALAIEKTLLEPLALDFVNKPLEEVVAFIRERANIEVFIDRKSMNDIGVEENVYVTIHVRSVPLRVALSLMLKQVNLAWTIQENVLLITTPEEAECILSTRVYDVSDLVVCYDADGECFEDYDTLIDMISSTIMPTTWDCVGGPGSIFAGSLGTARVLVFHQTYEVHYQVAALLTSIREIIKRCPEGELPRRNVSIARWMEEWNRMRGISSASSESTQTQRGKNSAENKVASNADEVIGTWHSSLITGQYVTIVKLADVQKTPSWKMSDENLPLSTHEVLLLAEQEKSKIVKNEGDWRWRFEQASLIPCEVD